MAEISTLNGYKIKDKKAIRYYNTVADMVADTTLKDGMHCKTKGYYIPEDGGHGEYTISNDNTLVNNNGSIHELQNGLKAKLLINKIVNIKQFGVKEDGESDDTNLIQNALDFIGNNTECILKGNKKYCKITGSLDVRAYSKISDLYLIAYDGTYINNFILYVNANATHSNWQNSYPGNEGYIKDCRFKNNTNNNYNGIFNFSNSVFENLYFDGFDIAFKVSPLYLDSYKISRLVSENKKDTTNYAVDLGYLGDQVEISQLHLLGGIYALNVGAGHNGITFMNCIIHGIINISSSNITFINLHNENANGKIIIDNSIVKITNGWINHNTNSGEHNFEIKNQSHVILENIKINYNLNNDDSSNDDIDINIVNSYVDVINCYKRILTPDIGENNLCVAKTNVALSFNNNQRYTTFETELINYETSQKNDTHGSFYSGGSSTRATWKLNSGTYYYKVVPVADFNRRIYFANNIHSYSYNATNGGAGFLITCNPGKYRIYRGTSENNYDKYVDVCLTARSLIDNGNIIGGYLWQDRTSGDIDTFNQITQVVYNDNNIKYFQTATPTVGTWKRGDIIYNNSNTGDVGWLCTTAGTPGTWKSL